MSDLKPCPFCGYEAEISIGRFDGKAISYVMCKKCMARGEFFSVSPKYASDDRAIEAWNRRAKDEQTGNMDDEEIIRQELEQKCWISPKAGDSAKRLNDLIFDINPAEICSQIESDNLKNWCKIVQTEMKMAMVQLPCWGEGETDGQR